MTRSACDIPVKFPLELCWDMAETGNYSDQEKALEYVKSLIRSFPDFPIPGILFR